MKTTASGLLSETSAIRSAGLAIRVVVNNIGPIALILVFICLPLDILISTAGRQLEKMLEATGISGHFQLAISVYVYGFAYLVEAAALSLLLGQVIEGEEPSLREMLAVLSGRRLLQVAGTLAYVNFVVLLPAVVYLVGFIILKPRGMFWLAAYLVPVLVSVKLLIDFSLTAFVTVFERSYYGAATTRSRQLVEGRRFWVSVTLGTAWLPVLFISISLVFLPDYFSLASSGLDTGVGLIRLLLESFVQNILIAWYFVFQALIYFRRRRERHDLTFFNSIGASALSPAFVAGVHDHD